MCELWTPPEILNNGATAVRLLENAGRRRPVETEARPLMPDAIDRRSARADGTQCPYGHEHGRDPLPVPAGSDALRADRPDVLVSDLGMPEVDGFELIGWVRALPREAGGQLPAIALTAFARPEDRLKALEAGFSTHISKPVEPGELIAAVASVAVPTAQMGNGAARGLGR